MGEECSRQREHVQMHRGDKLPGAFKDHELDAGKWGRRGSDLSQAKPLGTYPADEAIKS